MSGMYTLHRVQFILVHPVGYITWTTSQRCAKSDELTIDRLQQHLLVRQS